MRTIENEIAKAKMKELERLSSQMFSTFGVHIEKYLIIDIDRFIRDENIKTLTPEEAALHNDIVHFNKTSFSVEAPTDQE